MRKFIFFVLLSIFSFFYGCGVISEGFKSPKTDKSDEFLVEKKSPLRLPPNYNELPTPIEKKENQKLDEQSIKDLISNNENINNKSKNNSDLESSVLEKIKNN